MAIQESPSACIAAEEGSIAKAVLMPGDPLRAKFVAEHYLENPVCFNTVRNMLGYTGTYKGRKLSVMGHGMGVPSVGIYAYELYQFYGVESILRIGSAGALADELQLRDIVIAQGACTDSNWASQYHLAGMFAPIADFHMLETCVETAKEMGVAYHVGNILSSDRFYGDDGDMPEGWNANHGWQKMGVLAVEMEAAALYMNAARAGKRALAICTVSDHILHHEATTAEERQNGFTQMMELALKTSVKLEK